MKKSDFDERVIAQGIRNGHRHAFTRLYETHHRPLYHFSLKFLKSPALAEDAVHDVFLKLWDNRAFIDPELPLKPYLFKICKNHLLNQLARAGREESLRQEIGKALAFSHNGTEETVLAYDLEELVDEIVARLPTQRQRVFRMYKLEGMNLDEIAGQLGISKGTVKDHLFKANVFVRKCLAAQAGIAFDFLILLLLFYQAEFPSAS